MNESDLRTKTNQEQADLISYILNFNNKARPRNRDDKKIKKCS